jgi:hypothetical protein
MAVLLRQALDSGAPPSMARLPMTLEEVAAAYDEAERQRRGASGLPIKPFPSANRSSASRAPRPRRRSPLSSERP